MSYTSQTIVLKSADGALFRVSQEEIQHSILLRNIIGDNKPTAGQIGETIMPEENNIQEEVVLAPGEEPIPLANVPGPILKKVIEWLRHHKGDPVVNEEDEERTQEKAFRSTKNVEISDWDAQFTNVDQGTLFEIILAANYLDIRALLDLGCKTVANMLKGKTPEEIRKLFNIENDFTKEEEDQVRKENEWCEDPRS